MIYKFITFADVHWGAMDSTLMYNNLELILEFIRQMKDEIDFVVIAGDYFDYRLQLNSKTALLAIEWFDRLISTCKESNVKKVRMFKGTREHDNDQLEVFRHPYETDDGFFKIFNNTKSEELLPGLRCVYCPDENMNLSLYHQVYYNEFIPHPNIGFFHGNFDTILPEIEFNRIQEHNLSTMIYEYSRFSRVIKGPLISGHWHVKSDYDSLFYVGSFDRWKFNEEEDKGFIYGEINTETDEYFIHRINNPLAAEYKTIIVNSDDCSTPEQFAILSNTINETICKDSDMKLRVSYLMGTSNDEAMINFNLFQRKYATNRQVRIDLKDLVKREAKKTKKKQVEVQASKYHYVFNSDIKNIPEIVHQFILDSKNIDVPTPTIHKYISKYLENK